MSKSPSSRLPLPTIENRLGTTVNIVESNQGQTQIASHEESQELVELYYENHGSSVMLYQPNSIHSSVTQVSALAKKSFTYKCDLCHREFKEASHFSKHKRGALCHKIAQKLAKKNKQSKDGSDKKGAILTAAYKPYQCNLCGAKFFDKVNVELHLERTHQTQQPLWTEVAKTSGFACSECDLWFSDKIQLKHHQIQHPPQPHNHSCESTTNDINHHPIVHHQYFSQPLSHMAPSFSQNALHHTYSQLTPVSSLPQSQPLYQMLHQHHSPQIQQSHSNSSLSIAPSPNDGNNIPSSSHSHVHMGYPNISNNSALNSSTPTNTTKQPKSSKNDRCINSSIWNVCGDCGQKFIDPINLELHMQRKHPHSNIVETVSLSGGQTLYKTNNSDKIVSTLNLESVSVNLIHKNKLFECEALSDLSVQLPAPQNKQCGYSATVETTDSKDKKRLKGSKRNTMESPLKYSPLKCDICKKEFSSNAELIRHRVKDKNIMCGICSFSSCHNYQVAKHMYSCHKDAANNCPNLISPKVNEFCDQVSNITPSNQCEEIASIETSDLLNKDSSMDKDGQPSRLCCCMCSFYAKSGVSLAQHLQSHGSIHVKCGKCGETSSSFVEINKHINSSHSNEVIRVTLTMKASHTPSVYMFLITPKNMGSQAPNSLDNSSNNNSHNKPISFQDVYIYACSECGASLTGQYQLEAHLQLHQNNASVCQEIGVNSSESYTNDPSSCPSPLIHTQNTVEFRCQECGFWREQSDSVIKHIQSVHMSAKMVHSQRQNTGRIVGQTIHVFTPLSAMVSN